MAKRTGGGKKRSDGEGATGSEQGFEQTVEQLERIISDLESGELSLEDSLRSFENGVGLVRRAEAILNNAERRVEILLKRPGADRGAGDGPEVQPFQQIENDPD